jgi:hypothetical protein
MFCQNPKHLQENLFDFMDSFPEPMREEARKSEEFMIYTMFLCNIDETIFQCLYSANESRPNAPVNVLITALMLQHRRGWTTDELIRSMTWDLLTKVALGLRTLGESPFCSATYYNFKNRLSRYAATTGINLLEVVFDTLTKDQIETLELKTSINRSDSFQAMSNIRTYSRVELLIEVLIRLHRVLSKTDKERYASLFAPYVDKPARAFVYDLAEGEVDTTIASLAATYHAIHEALAPCYADVEVFRVFSRVFDEHFAIVEESVRVRGNNEMGSGTIQSPDDLEATYRKKNGQQFQGQVVNIVETANPENPLQLVIDVTVAPNNRDDSDIFYERIEHIKRKTPDWNESHVDGAFSCAESDQVLYDMGVVMVATAIRGYAAAGVPIGIEKIGEDAYLVTCPMQSVVAGRTENNRPKAEFDLAICAGCEHREVCKLRELKTARVYYFSEADYLRKQRQKSYERIPPERRTLRANVEATVAEFKNKTRNGKLRVRGAFRTAIFAFARAMSINFGRMYRYYSAQPA